MYNVVEVLKSIMQNPVMVLVSDTDEHTSIMIQDVVFTHFDNVFLD